jgi:hypothetical protein
VTFVASMTHDSCQFPCADADNAANDFTFNASR